MTVTWPKNGDFEYQTLAQAHPNYGIMLYMYLSVCWQYPVRMSQTLRVRS